MMMMMMMEECLSCLYSWSDGMMKRRRRMRNVDIETSVEWRVVAE